MEKKHEINLDQAIEHLCKSTSGWNQILGLLQIAEFVKNTLLWTTVITHGLL